jgi:hypothetical protein
MFVDDLGTTWTGKFANGAIDDIIFARYADGSATVSACAHGKFHGASIASSALGSRILRLYADGQKLPAQTEGYIY